ncbi:hypothetical protein KEM54_005364 [Ascosphaera aggregata]|nr:hypothetical protein KEM54_005364 [Ascosphaera aggregata]
MSDVPPPPPPSPPQQQQHDQAASWFFPAMPKVATPREDIRSERLITLMRQLMARDDDEADQNVSCTSEDWKKLYSSPTIRQPLHDETRLVDVYHLKTAMKAWLNAVPDMIEFNPKYENLPMTTLPAKGSRMVVAPHGCHFMWSGETAAFAYKALDLSKAKTIIILCDALFTNNIVGLALPDTSIKAYATPLTVQPLTVDEKRLDELRTTGKFESISREDEEREYTLEMQLIWLHHIFRKKWGDKAAQYPLILPIYVGKHFLPETNGKSYLKDLFADPQICVVVSADLTRWGPESNNYFYACRARTFACDVPIQSKYLPQPDNDEGTTTKAITRDMMWVKVSEKDIFADSSPIRKMAAEKGIALRHDPPIFETIAFTDHLYLRSLTLSPQIAYSSFLTTKQLLSTKSMGVSGALCVALSVLESMFGIKKKGSKGKNGNSVNGISTTFGCPTLHRHIKDQTPSERKTINKPVIGGTDLNTLSLETMPRTSMLKLVALLQEKNWLLKGRLMLLRYDRDRHTDRTSIPSTSFCAAYVVLD